MTQKVPYEGKKYELFLTCIANGRIMNVLYLMIKYAFKTIFFLQQFGLPGSGCFFKKRILKHNVLIIINFYIKKKSSLEEKYFFLSFHVIYLKIGVYCSDSGS